MEKILYGDDSLKLGKTYKMIGALYTILENSAKAKEYLKMAYKIFYDKGMEKLMDEVNEKIKALNSNTASAEIGSTNPTKTKSVKIKKK